MTNPSASTLPPRLSRLRELAPDLWWTWNAGRDVFRRLDYGLWRQTAHNPVMMLRPHRAGRAGARGRRSRVPRRLRRGARGARCRARAGRDRAGRWWHDNVGRRSASNGRRLLLRGVRAASVAADLCRRPRRARRRSLQGSERPRRAARRRRLHVSAGLLPPARSRRTAGSRKSTNSSTGPTRRSPTRADARRQAVRRRSCRWAPDGARAGVGGAARRACGCCCSTPTSNRTRPWDRELSARLYGGGQDMRLQQEIVLGLGGVLALRALGLDTRGLASQRRPRGVRRPAAPARSARGRHGVGRRARRRCGGRRCSRRTRRCPPVTTRSRSTWSNSTCPSMLGLDERPRRAVPARSGTTTRATGRSST